MLRLQAFFGGAVGIKGLVPSAFEKALKLALFLERAKPALRIPLRKRFVSRTLPRYENSFFDNLYLSIKNRHEAV